MEPMFNLIKISHYNNYQIFNLKMMQATDEGTILQMVQQLGPAVGAKKMLTWEFAHAREAEESGMYITWRSPMAKDDCFRVGTNSRCFCGHLFSAHEK